MVKQFCRTCGKENLNEGTLPLVFCTHCGARLTAQTQNYAPNYPTVPTVYSKKKLSGSEKLLFGFLISIPVILILTGIGVVALLIFLAVKKGEERSKYQPPKTTSSPQKPTNLLLTIGKDGLGQGEFKNAQAVAVDKAGNIYVGDGTLRIQKFDSSGKYLQLWNVTEGTVKSDEQYNKAITNLAVDSQNRLYVVVDRTDLLRYDGATGKFIDIIKLYGEKWMNTQQEARIMDMVMLNDDKLVIFATSFPQGEYVMTVSSDGKSEIKYKDLLKKQDKDSTTIISGSILVNVTGDLFLRNGLSTANKTYLYHFKPDGSYVDRFTWEGAPTIGVSTRKDIALNSKGEIYAYNFSKSQINVLSSEGVLLRSIPLKTDYFEKMILDSDDNIFVVSRNKVEKFSASGI